MRKEYDVSKGKRGAIIASPGKSRITIMLDDDILEFVRVKAESARIGYQTLINAELKTAVARSDGKVAESLTAERLRQILREELHVT